MVILFVRKLASALVVLLIASVIVFLGGHALPGDPISALLAQQGGSPEVETALRDQYGLNDPLYVQYLHWAGSLLQGNFGTSIRTGSSVTETIVQRLPVTLELAVLSLLVACLVGISAGIVAAVRKGKLLDHASTLFGLIGLSIPSFWLGIVLIMFFSIRFRVFPAAGFVPVDKNLAQNLTHLVLPAVVLGSGFAAVIMRQMRSAMIGSLMADYIRTARSKGLSEWRVVCLHAVRNSLLTVVTILGLQLGALISGAVVTEQIFSIPGFGSLIVDAVAQRDYAMVQAVAMVTAIGYVVVNLLVDLAYTFLNPRIRVSGAAE
jgi:peptide/nickel transport system permease protein